MVAEKKVPRAPRGPSSDEMKDALLSYLQEHHPDQLMSALGQEFDRLGWQLIFTPPYKPQFQPIEMLWSHVKGYLGWTFQNGRTMADILRLLHDAFVGNSPDYTPVDCSKLIRHAQKDIMEFARNDPLLEVTDDDITTIRFKSQDDGAALSLAQSHVQSLEDAAAEESLHDAMEDDEEED